MSGDQRLKVVLFWHMHQPEYRDLVSGEYQLPWTYLHAIKDYVDMAALLEENPAACAVVNFAPVLLDQIDDYARQVYGYLNDSAALRDPLLAALDEPALPVRSEQRLNLIKMCLRANEKQVINRFPQYQRLAEMAAWMDDKSESIMYLGDQYLSDILVWYHLAWIGETVRRHDHRVIRLMEKGSGFSLHERRELLEVIGDLLAGLTQRYKRLVEQGQVELSMNPYAHPMIPLLLDLSSARDAMPNIQLPLLQAYPGGEERARWHIEQGLAVFERSLGVKPVGCWPSEGGVSAATLALFEQFGFRWTATGQNVLRNSLSKAGIHFEGQRANHLHRPYKLANQNISCFFRDDGLSDLIGFTYSDWHGDDAVSNLIHHLEVIAKHYEGQRDCLVPIILDGENAWEHYPNNGYYFLSALYERLSSHPNLELTTFSQYLDHAENIEILPKLISGSWVYGTFSTWIGDKDKNRAWDMLGEAKRAFDMAMKSGYLVGDHRLAAERQLAACEGSDWFWWFGDYNPADTVSDFERLFRLHLSNFYQLIGEEPPEYLTHPVSHGGGKPHLGGTMRPGQEQ